MRITPNDTLSVMIRFPTILCALLVGTGVAFSQQTLPARAEQARHEAADASTQVLKAMLESDDSPRQHSAIRELAARKTDEARALLLQAALGAYGKRTRGVARHWLFESLDDKAQAREFLRWDTLAGLALVKMRGIAVDAGLWEYIRPRLDSADLDLRLNCVELLKDDPGGFDPTAKVTALIASLTSATELPAARAPYQTTLGEESADTQLDHYFSRVTIALAFAEGITVDLLRELTPAEDGLAREAAIIARRWRGDQEAAPEFRRVMEHGMFPGSRIQAIRAVNALRGPGSLDPADLEVLRRVAVGDTNSFIPGQRYRGHKPEPRFQVREAATWVLDELALREKLEEQVTPPP